MLTRPDAALAVENLSFRYGRRLALHGVSFEVAPGEAALLLGPNGAGKTTLFSILSGLFRPTSGTARIAGRSLASGSSALAPLGIVFQHPALDLDLTVGQNLRYAASLRGLSGTEATRAIDRELGALGMADRLRERVRALSGGHRRRIEVARALLHRPSVLLLDEPTVGLDIPTRRALIEHLHERARAGGIALLWATHLADEVWPDDRVLVISAGRIVADGSAAVLLARTGAGTLPDAFARLTAPEPVP